MKKSTSLTYWFRNMGLILSLAFSGCSEKVTIPSSPTKVSMPLFIVSDNQVIFGTIPDSFKSRSKEISFLVDLINQPGDSINPYQNRIAEIKWDSVKTKSLHNNSALLYNLMFSCLKDYRQWSWQKYNTTILNLIDIPIPDSIRENLTIDLIKTTGEVHLHFFSESQIFNPGKNVLAEIEKLTLSDTEMIQIYNLISANYFGSYNSEVKKYLERKHLLNTKVAKYFMDDDSYNKRDFMTEKISKSELYLLYGLFPESDKDI